jgi:hypothetical protein
VSTLDRQLDNRWNLAVDALTQAWDRLGPDTTLAWVTALARSGETPEGLVLINVAAMENGEVA